MDRTETRLQQAAEETRQAARHAIPPSLDQKSWGGSGWLVLATAFVAVLVVFSLIPLIAGPETDEVGSLPGPTTTGVAPSTTAPLDYDCSAAGVPVPEDLSDLPGAVASTAGRIIEAAASCQLDGLERLGGDELVTSFGGGGVDNLRIWEQEGRGELGTILELFGTSHAVIAVDEGPEIYVWPAAFAYDTWDEIPEAHRSELLEIYTEAELDEIATFGSYAGWRIGIDENGEWLFFVAGD